MMDVPDADVMQDAQEAYMKARSLARGGPAKVGEVIWSPIAAAIMAERERCAKVADLWANRDTGREIAAAIRRGTP